MAGRKSKRLTLRKKAGIARRVRENFRKQRKEETKREKLYAKMPRSLLLSGAQKEQLLKIKEETKMRNEEYLQEEKSSVEPHIRDIAGCLEGTDIFVEMTDYRDMAGSRSRDCEELLKRHGKKVYVWPNYRTDAFAIDCRSIESEGMEILHDYDIFHDKKSVCVFGSPKTGKFHFTKQLEIEFPGIAVRVVKAPLQQHCTLADVLRGAASEDSVEFLFYFEKLFSFIDKAAFADFYMLPCADVMQETLLALGRRVSAEYRNRRIMEAGARSFFRDVKANRILWARTGSQYSFIFT